MAANEFAPHRRQCRRGSVVPGGQRCPRPDRSRHPFPAIERALTLNKSVQCFAGTLPGFHVWWRTPRTSRPATDQFPGRIENPVDLNRGSSIRKFEG